MARLISIVLVVLLTTLPALGAERLFYENFNDGTVDGPAWGNLGIFVRERNGYTSPWCPATTPGQYIVSRPGYGGRGYCFSNPQYPTEGASKDPYIVIYPSNWGRDKFYISYRYRIVNARSVSYQNSKLVYNHWEGSKAYAMFNTTSTWLSSLYYSAKDNNGNYIESGTEPYVGVNPNDGQWHKWAQYVNFSTGEVALWVDEDNPTLANAVFYRNYDDSVWQGANMYRFAFTLGVYTDNPWDYKELDDLEIWDDIPTGEEPPGDPCETDPQACENQIDCTSAGWNWCTDHCQEEECPSGAQGYLKAKGIYSKGMYLR